MMMRCRLQAQVDSVTAQLAGHTSIGLQIRQARWCDKLSLAADAGGSLCVSL